MQGIRMKNPAHPGGFVKSEIVEALGLSVTGAARVLGVTRPALSALLNERASLSPEMAHLFFDTKKPGSRRRSACRWIR